MGMLVNQLKPLWPNAKRHKPVVRRLRDDNVLERRPTKTTVNSLQVAEAQVVISIVKFLKYCIYEKKNGNYHVEKVLKQQ